MTAKTSKQLIFNTDLKWESKDKGKISSQLIKVPISVSTPPEFGGEEGEWSPEHLFLSSVSSCFMSTFLVFVKKFKFEISNFECAATGQVDLVDGKYQFTFIHLYPKAIIKNETDKSKAELALEKAKKYCLVSNSINADVSYHPQIGSV